jgi:hypothetical protein
MFDELGFSFNAVSGHSIPFPDILKQSGQFWTVSKCPEMALKLSGNGIETNGYVVDILLAFVAFIGVHSVHRLLRR